MANRKKIDAYEAARMMDRDVPITEIAEHFGVSESGIRYALRSIDYKFTKQRSHKKWLPWVLKEEHKNSEVATYIRRLSRLAYGDRLYDSDKDHKWAATHAVNWAARIVEEGRDVDYNEDIPPNEFSSAGGFFLRDANPANWRLKMLLAEVRRVQSRIR